MDQQLLFRWGLIVLSFILVYLAYLVVQPFILTVIMSLIMSFVFYPLYKRIAKIMKMKRIASFVSIVIIFLLIILPSAYFASNLVTESSNTYRTFLDYDFKNAPFLENIPYDFVYPPQDLLDGIIKGVKDYVVLAAPDIVGEVAKVLVHLFIFFFIMFFAFVHGPEWYSLVRNIAPLRADVKKHLFTDLERVLHGIIYGQLVTAIIQGTLGGLMFFIFGIPNPAFWGFVMIIFAFIPFLGTPLIFIPAAILELIQGDYVSGVGVLVVGLVFVMNIDNFIRPYLVSRFAPIHPILVILGVFGGLAAFGLVGFIIGPLILALLVTLFRDFAAHKELLG